MPVPAGPITIEFNKVSVDRIMKAVVGTSKKVSDLRLLWWQWRISFMLSEVELFATEGESGSYGEWPALSEKYAEWKRNHAPVVGATILVFSGALRASLTSPNADQVFVATRDKMMIGTSIPYAYYHQHGDGVPVRKPVDISPAAIKKHFVPGFIIWAKEVSKEWNE